MFSEELAEWVTDRLHCNRMDIDVQRAQVELMVGSDTFADRLHHYPGGPWVLTEAREEPDALVLQLCHLDALQQWCSPSTFLDFLDNAFHRCLPRCLIGRPPAEQECRWSYEDLLQATRPSSEEALQEALTFCVLQQFALPSLMNHDDGDAAQIEGWKSNLGQLHSFGPTFEWIVQALLQHHVQGSIMVPRPPR
jgi:hypothetical protein